MKGKKAAEVAAQEAFEEAGLLGKIIGKKPLGNFHYPIHARSGDMMVSFR
jgi:8-oxo-dGTP pyrophosphatase MutT (NUDIX family)